jgi:hypothetical protein
MIESWSALSASLIGSRVRADGRQKKEAEQLELFDWPGHDEAESKLNGKSNVRYLQVFEKAAGSRCYGETCPHFDRGPEGSPF